MGVYKDNNGAPGSLILDAGEVTVTNGWISISNLNLAVTQGTYYWIAYVLQSTNGVRYQSGRPANSHYYVFRSYGPLPASFSLSGDGFGYNDNEYVIRVTVKR
jgi:hypothetical protein